MLELILVHFQLEKESMIEMDILDKAIGSCLSQLDKLGQLQLVVYYSRKLTKAELNYNVYDKEMLAIVECFRT